MNAEAAERRDRAQAVIAGLGTLLALSVVALLVVTLAWRSSSGDQVARRALALQRAGAQAQVAARKAIVEMSTYDYAHADQDSAWVDTAGTASFRKRYAVVSAPIRRLVVQMKARAHGTVIASAADVSDPDHVTVLLFVDQTISSPGQTRTSLDQPRVTMTMVRNDGRWLVDDVEVDSVSTH